MQSPVKQAYVPVGFNNATRQSIIQGNPFNYTANGIDQKAIPPVGLLSRIIIPVEVTFTTGATPPTNKNTYPWPSPYGLIRRVIVRANEGAELFNMTGWGCYLASRIVKEQNDVRNPEPSYGSVNTAAKVFNLPATYAATTTYTIRFPIEINLAWADSLQAGLILIQNLTTRLTCEIQWGDAGADMLDMVTGAPSPLTGIVVSANPALEIYNAPAHVEDYPDLSMVHIWSDELTPLVTTGDFNYRPALGNTYLNVLQHFRNGNAAMNPLTDFTNLRLSYSQTQQMYNLTVAQQLWYQRHRLGGMDLPDGTFWWAFAYGSGLLEVPNTRDVIDTSRLTDLSFFTGINSSVVLAANSQVYTVKEMLVGTR